MGNGEVHVTVEGRPSVTLSELPIGNSNDPNNGPNMTLRKPSDPNQSTDRMVEEADVDEIKELAVVKPIALWQECMGEFFGTMVLILFGTGVVAQVVLSDGGAGNYTNIALTWGMAVTAGIYASKGTCPSHLNPAVTLSFALFRDFKFYKMPFYWISQIAGAFMGALIVYSVYFPDREDQIGRSTAGIFATYPQPDISWLQSFWTEIVGTALLMAGIFVVGENRSKEDTMPGFLGPIMVGALVVLIGMAFGYNTGYAINPARDLGPRMMTAMFWGREVFEWNDYYFWIPIVGPMIGGPLGCAVYELMLGMHY
eukprot:CFRG2278T1